VPGTYTRPLAPLIASRTPEVAFIILHAGASVPVWRQGELLLEHELRAYGFPEEEIAKALAYQRLNDAFTRTGQGWDKLQEASRRAAEAHAEWLLEDLQPPDHWFRQMYRKLIDFDPLPAWRQVKCPVLAFFGELDHNVPPEPNRRSWRRSSPKRATKPTRSGSCRRRITSSCRPRPASRRNTPASAPSLRATSSRSEIGCATS